jgi:hypothetical protein
MPRRQYSGGVAAQDLRWSRRGGKEVRVSPPTATLMSMSDESEAVGDGYPRMLVERRTGDELLHQSGSPGGPSLLEFWRWSSSDLLSNALRGVLAEFIVGTALDAHQQGVRSEWDPYDLTTPEGVTVEVKSAAYIQSWHQKRPSLITFGIRPTQSWNPATNAYDARRRRQAQVYVFCLLAHRDQATIDPLNLDQWRFLVVATRTIEEKVGAQKTIGLESLLRLEPHDVSFDELAAAIRAAAIQPST